MADGQKTEKELDEAVEAYKREVRKEGGAVLSMYYGDANYDPERLIAKLHKAGMSCERIKRGWRVR